MTLFPGSVAYRHPEEVRWADVPYPSADTLRDGFEKFFQENPAAWDMNSGLKTSSSATLKPFHVPERKTLLPAVDTHLWIADEDV